MRIIKRLPAKTAPARTLKRKVLPGIPIKSLKSGEVQGSSWDPYKILEIRRGASQEDIKRAYRQLAGKYHPDKVEHLGDEFKVIAEKRFKEIQQAYQELRSK